VDFDDRVDELRREYRKRRDAMLVSAEKRLATLGISSNRPSGGFFIWADTPSGVSAKKFAHYAVKEEKIGIIPGTAFYPSGTNAGDGSFRLSYAKVSTGVIDEAMQRLAKAFQSYPPS
jgi:2-aminoadipate transaminase